MQVMLAKQIIAIAAVAMLAPNGAGGGETPAELASARPLGVRRVVDAAMRTLEQRRMLYSDEFKLTTVKRDDKWILFFVFEPETAGGDLTVVVNPDGRVDVHKGF